MRKREEGCVFVYVKSDAGPYTLPRSEYQRLKQEWMAGRAFFEGVGYYGAVIVIRLGDVVAIADTSAESFAAHAEDEKARRHEDALDQ